MTFLFKIADTVDKWATTLSYSTLAADTDTAITSSFDTIYVKLVSYEKELVDEIADTTYNPAYDDGAVTLDSPNWSDFTAVTKSSLLGGLSTDPARFDAILSKINDMFETLNDAFSAIVGAAAAYESNFDKALYNSFPIYKNIVKGINDSNTTMPPSGAVAGVFAAVDRDRGVWKAPANVSLASVIGPGTTFTASQLDALNIDVNAGKSINAIRAFTGKGTLIWGARTLAGNDNEWRYIPVRRFFNMVEESIKKSTYWAVFEPNSASTWVKVRGMIENYLTNKWKDGALVGAKPDEAFFVKVGLGTTMTAQDILEGRMNVEIGMAVVRPAEFIILKFSHKLQQS
jgi:hypothetical protein